MPRKKKSEDDRTVLERQKTFLQAYADLFSVERAAEVSGVNRTSHHRWVRKNPKYAEAFAKIKAAAGDYLESVAIARAGEGWLEPVYYQGSPCGEVRRFDSGLLQFLLRGLMPDRYGAKTEITGAQGAPLQAKIEVVFVKPSGDS